MDQTPPLTTPDRRSRGWLDKAGIGLAGLCAVHCVASIVLVVGLGVGGHLLLAPEIHEIGLAVAFMIAAIAIGWGTLKHRRPLPLLIAAVGLGFMGAALVMGHGHHEAWLTIIGVSLVAVGHVLNLRDAARHVGSAPA